MVLLCGGARSGPGDGAPDTGRFLGALEGGDEYGVEGRKCFSMIFGCLVGLLFKPLKPLKSLKSLEISQKPRNLPEGACSRLLQNVFVFLRDPKATLDI